MGRNEDDHPKGQPPHGGTASSARIQTKRHWIWTPEEDATLQRAVKCYRGEDWKNIAKCLPNKTACECSNRWNNIINPELVKGRWSRQEDEILIQMIDKHGPNMWPTIAQAIPGRTKKQCQDRWKYGLNPAIKKDAWSQQEEITLIHAHQIYGDKWIKLMKFLPGRTNDAIKKHWKHVMKKKLDSYLASGLLQKFPFLGHNGDTSKCIPTPATVQQSGDTDYLKDSQSEDSSESNQPPSAFATSSQAKQGLHNIGAATDDSERRQNAHKLQGKDSDDVVKVSEMADGQMASYKQPENVETISVLLSGSAELKGCIAEGNCSPGSLEKEKSMRSIVDGHIGSSSLSNFHQDVAPEGRNVAPGGTSKIFFSSVNCQLGDEHCSETPSSFDLATASDLLDMPYCQSLMIIPPVSPREGNSMHEGVSIGTNTPWVAGTSAVAKNKSCTT